MTIHPATITNVEPKSAAARAGLQTGDRLLTLNGQRLRDVIDVQVYAAEAELIFEVERAGKTLSLKTRRRYGEALGLDFAGELFEGLLRVCRNACDFCFVAQMPPGLRAPLYVKDDDYRLSFLHGNYVTLTNLDEADWERIEAQFLSPLYVSVHATEPEVRVGLMHNPRAGQILEDLERLVDLGIEVHTQVVLAPGRNDGAHLECTVGDLAALYPGVAGVTVVPVGLTRGCNPALRPYRDDEAAAVLAQCLEWQAELREVLGTGFIYPSDEWFLRAGVPVPPVEAYDGLLPALIENGVGMVRLFLEEWGDLQSRMAAFGGPRQVWVTGTLFAPVLREQALRFTTETGIPVEVVAVPNRAFGETVTVAGLLTVADILDALHSIVPANAAPGIVVLPDEIFRGPEGRSLDGQLPGAIAEATGWCVRTI
ncbi:MAG: DUF512 domain-containing protein [Anaerolineae bacterium]|nr:DUF512 domain-containing protein [Anaerolineae bacterium]